MADSLPPGGVTGQMKRLEISGSFSAVRWLTSDGLGGAFTWL